MDAAPLGVLLPAGSRLGAYEVRRPLGSGAFADVYLARHVLLEQDVALKIIRSAVAEDREREGAKIMSRLRHPHVVSVQFADRIDGRLVIAMDYVEGQTLRQVLDAGGPLAPERAVGIAMAICEALDYVHGLRFENGRDVAHLDLKPGNVLVQPDGTVRITDFGLAHLLGNGVSGTAPVAGSPAYMAPEQFAGKPCQASDLWAVGVLLWEMLAGEPPFRGASPRDYQEQIAAGTIHLDSSRVPERLAGLARQCLQRDPAQRPRSARALASALSLALEGEEARCPHCRAPLPAAGANCPECTFVEDRPRLHATTVARPAPGEVPTVGAQPQPRRALRRTAVIAVLALVAFGGYGAFVVAPDAGAVRAALDDANRPGLTLEAREATLRTAPATVWPQLLRARVDRALASVREGQALWQQARDLEASTAGSYDDRTRALRTFAVSYAGTAEATEASRHLQAWEREAALFQAVADTESRPAAKISEKLARWIEFLAQQTTGFRKTQATERSAFWIAQLAGYRGYAELSVLGASGLPPTDTTLVGREQPDAYFVIVRGKNAVYQSLAVLDNPAPAWNERYRLLLAPGDDMFLEIRDRDPIGYDLLLRQKLTPLPPDGPFRITSGGIEVRLEVRRER
jgi:hypothetical protein